jgi:hypothetical protein
VILRSSTRGHWRPWQTAVAIPRESARLPEREKEIALGTVPQFASKSDVEVSR